VAACPPGDPTAAALRPQGTGRVLSEETLYAVNSLIPAQASPAALLRLRQAHWTIENRPHWVRDVVFGEDQATTHTAHDTELSHHQRTLQQIVRNRSAPPW
jgi:predicted transposase YbfD/YdcC